MTSPAHRIAIGAAALALVAGGCGSDEDQPLPQSASQQILLQVEAIGSRAADGSPGACDDIFDGVPDGTFEQVDAELAGLPADVDSDVRSALEESVERLKQLVDERCDEIRGVPEEETTPQETVTEETTTTETETVPTTPETTPTTPETTPTAPETAPDGGGTPTGDGPGRGRGPDGSGPPGQRGGAEAP